LAFRRVNNPVVPNPAFPYPTASHSRRHSRGLIRGRCGLSLLTLLLLVSKARAGAGGTDATTGTPWVGSMGVRDSTGAVQARGLTNAVQHRPFRIHARPKTDFIDSTRPDPMAPDSPHWPLVDQPVPGPLTATNGQTPDLNFTGATLSDTGAFPPDSMGAVGPSQFIVAVNGRIRSFNKATGVADGFLDVDTDFFFSSVMTPPVNDNFTSDPRIRYDRLSGRWFIIMIDVPGTQGSLPNRVMLAVSDSGVINNSTTWTYFFFQHDQVGTTPNADTGGFADYPTLGIDANALYIGVNVFGVTGVFANTTAFVVRKSSVLGPGPIVVTAFRGLIPSGNSGGPYTPQGVDNYDPAATEGYFIGVNSRFFGRLTLRRVGNPGGTPTLSGNVTITVPVNGGTINVPHLGNTGGAAGNLDGLDYRLMAAHFRKGRLWTSENMAVNNTGSPSGTDSRLAVRWYELQGIPTGQTPSVVQSGTLYQPSSGNTSDQRCYWMGSVMVSGQGHAALGFSVAGANERVNAGTVGRLVTDPLGALRTPVLYTASSSAYNPVDSGGNPINRWGDYSYTSLDPSDDMTMWTIQEWCNAPNSYAVQVLRLLAPPPAMPTNCNPAAGFQGTNLNVVVTGTSQDGSGFFDPGPGFSNRISATVNGGGVTLTNIIYSNPTHVTLGLAIASNAIPGARTLTITNPDGQSLTTATALFTINAVVVSNHPPALTAISNRVINELTLLTFTNTATDPDGNQLTYSLAPGAPTNASINSSNGVFTWTPTEAQGPSTSNAITVRVVDNGSPPMSNSVTFFVTVNEVNSPPIPAAVSNRTVFATATLLVTNTASDPDIPANTLTFTLGPGAPTNATLNSSNGVFAWTPVDSQAGPSNAITVRVTDNGSPPMSNSVSFSVNVLPRPVIQSIVASTNDVTINWSAVSGRIYRVQSATNLPASWSDIPGDVTASGPTAFKVDSSPLVLIRYYRVTVVP
jgi:hypothetical protein